MSDTKKTILARLLAVIDDTYDKSEGSFFYDALMPVAIELEKSYEEKGLISDRGFADTSTGTYLDKIVTEQGLTRKMAGYATTAVTIKGTVGAMISIGDKVSTDVVNFLSLENVTIGATGIISVSVKCEVAGTTGNVPIGAIKSFPVTIQGLTSVTNLVAVTDGYDEEIDAELRVRYYAKVQTPATSGNKYHYVNWATSVTGVGSARIVPLWNGNGTVKVIIINSNKVGAGAALVANVASYIEDNRPIGATVTVVSATEKAITISATVTIDTANYTLAQVKTAIQTSITKYLAEIAFIKNYVSYASIGSTIFNTIGVEDYSNLLVNGGTTNITVADTEVAVIGSVTLG